MALAASAGISSKSPLPGADHCELLSAGSRVVSRFLAWCIKTLEAATGQSTKRMITLGVLFRAVAWAYGLRRTSLNYLVSNHRFLCHQSLSFSGLSQTGSLRLLLFTLASHGTVHSSCPFGRCHCEPLGAAMVERWWIAKTVVIAIVDPRRSNDFRL